MKFNHQKIIDFGLSKIFGDNIKVACGSHLYVAPKVMEASQKNPLTVSEKPDVYSQAKLICFLFDGFYADHKIEHKHKTEVTQKIGARFLEVKESERPSLEELRELLQEYQKSNNPKLEGTDLSNTSDTCLL